MMIEHVLEGRKKENASTLITKLNSTLAPAIKLRHTKAPGS